MNVFTIKDLENLSGIKAHTIRIWEQRYHFLKPRRTNTNIRCYCNDELKTLLNIALLNKYGFKISHIDRMEPGEINERVLSLNDPDAVQERIVNDLIREMVNLDMEAFQSIITKYSRVNGMEQLISKVFFPFLEKIGLLWQTGQINPAQEHLVTNIIRQKLIVAIEKTDSPHCKDGKKVLLYLPEGEHHELGLLFLYYLLKSRGTNVIYLGANVPLNDVEYVVQMKKPELAFIHLTSIIHPITFDILIKQLQKRFSHITTVISGQVCLDYQKKLPAGIQLKRSLPEMTTYLDSLQLSGKSK